MVVTNQAGIFRSNTYGTFHPDHCRLSVILSLDGAIAQTGGTETVNKNHTSRRARKYPAAERAMRGYIVIEQSTTKVRPMGHVNLWPDYYEQFDQRYAHFDDGPTSPAKPSPVEIDSALEWVQPCQFMWESRDRREWEMFQAYAHGASVLGIADHNHVSRQRAGDILDSIFNRIQMAAEAAAFRRDRAG